MPGNRRVQARTVHVRQQNPKVVPSIDFYQKWPCTGCILGFLDSIRIRNIRLEIKEYLDTGESVA